MAKKRKEPAQSTTLDTFFKKGGNASNKKPKLRPEAGTKPSAKPKDKKLPFNIAPEDIIVIDSDDDANEPVLVDDSSDIEVVEEPLRTESYATGSAKVPPTRIVHSLQSTCKLSGNTLPNALADKSELSHSMSFGEPSLLGVTHERIPRVRTSPCTLAVEDEPDFGTPSLLYDKPEDVVSAAPPDASDPIADAALFDGTNHTHARAQQSSLTQTETQASHPARPAPRPIQRSDSNEDLFREGTSFLHRPVTTATLADQWELGDDEAVAAILASADVSPDDSQQPGFELPLHQQSDRALDDDDDDVELIQTCPICNALLDSFSALVSTPTGSLVVCSR